MKLYIWDSIYVGSWDWMHIVVIEESLEAAIARASSTCENNGIDERLKAELQKWPPEVYPVDRSMEWHTLESK